MEASGSGATLRRPVQIVKKHSGPLDEALSELQQSGSDVATAATVALATPVAPLATAAVSGSQPVVVPRRVIESAHVSHAPTASTRHRASAGGSSAASSSGGSKEKDKKRERWLLTRKTWKYMTDAGRKLIPDTAQNRREDIPKIEAHFQQVCAAEPHFVLWRRKCSYPGATRNSRRRLKQLLQHTGRHQQHQALRAQQEAHNADRLISWLQAYLRLDEAYKTTTLLGSNTVRPDQTASPSAQRPTDRLPQQPLAVGAAPTAPEQQLNELTAQLERLRALSRGATLQGVQLPLERITPAILEDRALLKQIYNALKKQQLHRVLSQHAAEPPTTTPLKHASSLSSLWHFGGGGLTTPHSSKQQQQERLAAEATAAAMAALQRKQQQQHEALAFAVARSSGHNSRIELSSAAAGTTARQRKPPSTLALLPRGSCKQRQAGKQPRAPPPLIEKQYNSCGTQTNFIQLQEIKRLAEEYKQRRLADEAAASPQGGTDEETELLQRGSGGTFVSTLLGHQRRKSSIDNEDVSQSVSDTIKRYLRMARKKSVHDGDANRFKRVNYDRNLRNIRAKGEINPPGLDEGNDRAVQTLDAWPLLQLAHIRGSADCASLLAAAHAEWQRALDERLQKQRDYERLQKQRDYELSRLGGVAAAAPGSDACRQFAHGKSPHSSGGSSSSAPTSPTADQFGGGAGSSSSAQLTPLTPPSIYAAATTPTAGGGGLLHTSSQFFSNLWHGAAGGGSSQQQEPHGGLTGDSGSGDSGSGDSNNNSQHANLAAADMQKSKSSSNVGQFVSRKILKNRSKSQTRPATQHAPGPPLAKWAPSDKFTWTSESGERLVLRDTALQHLSEIETQLLQRVALQKISELNAGINISADSDSKSRQRQVLPKKKAMTTSFFDIGKKYESGNASIFGNSLECCVANDMKRSSQLSGATHERGSRTSLATLFRGSSGANSSDSNNKLDEDVRSCESLPTSESAFMESGHNGKGYFGSLAKSSSAQISRSQSDVRRKSQELDTVPGGGLFDSLPLRQRVDVPAPPLQVPSFVSACVRHLEQQGLHQVGLFRVSTSKKRLNQMRDDFDKHGSSHIDAETCAHDVATLLKEFLRDLPEPLLCNHLYQAFLQTQRIRNRRLQLEAISHLVKLLPAAHRDTLYVLLRFLARVAAFSDDVTNPDGSVQISGNKMDSNNLARVFAPNVLRGSQRAANEASASGRAAAALEEQESMNDAINVIRIMIDHYEDLFRIPAELIDVVYSHMLDLCPDKLYKLCEQRSMLAAREDEVSKSNSSLALTDNGSFALSKSLEPTANSAQQSQKQQQQPKRLYTRESVMHDNDAARAPEIANAAAAAASKRHAELHVSRGARHDEAGRRIWEAAVDRRQSSPNVLNKCGGIVSASLQIPVPGPVPPAHRKSVWQQQQLDEVAPLPTGLVDLDNNNAHIPYIEDASPGADHEYGSEYFPISGSLSFSTKLEQATNTQPLQQQQPSGKDSLGNSSGSSTFRLRHDARAAVTLAGLAAATDYHDATAGDYKLLNAKSSIVNEPKLPASISNIGGAILRSKTADFERMSLTKAPPPQQQQQKSPASVTSPNTTTTNIPKSTHLYKRQELISSSKRAPK